MTRRGSVGERSIALFLLGIAAFSPPLVSIFDVDAVIFGIPVLYVYLFIAWAALIALIARATVPTEGGAASDGEAARPGREEGA
jgi:hypothetical protein